MKKTPKRYIAEIYSDIEASYLGDFELVDDIKEAIVNNKRNLIRELLAFDLMLKNKEGVNIFNNTKIRLIDISNVNDKEKYVEINMKDFLKWANKIEKIDYEFHNNYNVLSKYITKSSLLEATTRSLNDLNKISYVCIFKNKKRTDDIEINYPFHDTIYKKMNEYDHGWFKILNQYYYGDVDVMIAFDKKFDETTMRMLYHRDIIVLNINH